jgi:signal transduction histidine kinase
MLVQEIEDNLPLLEVDALRIRHVLRNLITNALNATPAEGKIVVTAQKLDRGRVTLSVLDTGSGINAEEYAKIFARYYQLTPTGESRAGGPGLGLSVVQLLVELHGGQIHLESSLDQGSTFAIML